MTDVLIVGLGGAGGIAADVLTRAGLEVVALEAGPRRVSAEMTQDEIRNDVHAWLCEPKARGELPTWREDESSEAGASPWPLLMVNGVGGSTVHYPGLSARFHPWNFAARSATIARYGASAIPAGSTVADWPLDYDELEPFYDAVEREIGVAGQAGNLAGALRPGGSAFEGARAARLPDAAAAAKRLDRAHRSGCPGARLAPVPGAGGDQLRALQRQPILHVLWVLREQRVLPGRQGLDRRDGDPARRGDRPPADRDGRPRHRHHHRWRRSRHRCGLRAGRARAALLGTGGAGRDVHLREHAAAPAVELARVPARARRTATIRSAGTTWRTSRPFVFGRFPGRRLNLFTGLSGPGHVRGRLERRQLRSRRTGLHRWWPAGRAARDQAHRSSRAVRSRRRSRASDLAGRHGSRPTPSPSAARVRRWSACPTRATASISTRGCATLTARRWCA